MWLIAIGIGLLGGLLIWDYIHKRHRNAVFTKCRLTGPPVHPLIGCGLDAILVGAKNLIPYLGECQRRYGKSFRMWMLNEALIFTSDVRFVGQILTSTTHLAKGDFYDMFRPWLADGLLLSVGRKWHARRKIFTPAFHFRMLEQYLAVFDEQSAILVRRLAKHADGQTEVDIFPEICVAALDVIIETAMGVKVHAQSDSNCSYVKDLKTVAHIQANRLPKITQRYDWWFRLTAPFEYRRLIQAIRSMHVFTTQVIEERRQVLVLSMADGSHRLKSDDDDADVTTKRRMSLLDILLQSQIDGQPLSNDDILEEVNMFVFAGDDTSSSAASHILHCISRHPEVQQKLATEIEMVFGRDQDSPVTMSQLQELKYMECVIKETMRLYPTVPILGRKINEDLKLDDDLTIPAKTSIYLLIYYLHRDPNVFPDPEEFRPERFVIPHSRASDRNPFAYTPFSAGPKNCIGQKFAMLELKTMISKILRYYEILPLGRPLEPLYTFILRSQHGMIVGLKPRTFKQTREGK